MMSFYVGTARRPLPHTKKKKFVMSQGVGLHTTSHFCQGGEVNLDSQHTLAPFLPLFWPLLNFLFFKAFPFPTFFFGVERRRNT